MRRILTITASVFCGCMVTTPVFAQPILDRVEQQLRQQLAAPAPVGNAADNSSEPGYLGVIANDREELGRGVRILNVVAGAAAALGGLEKNDLITSINGLPVRDMREMAKALEGQSAGAKLTIVVNRNGTESQQEVTLGRRPVAQPIGKTPGDLPAPLNLSSDDANRMPTGPRLGMRTLPITEEARQQLKLSDTKGAMVSAVTPGLPADRAGIPLGAIIMAVDGQAVDSPQGLAAIVRRSGKPEVELTYLNQGQETRKRVQFAPVNGPQLELRGRPVDRPAPPTDADNSGAQADAKSAALEARIRELEARLEKLEAAVQSK